MIAVVNMIDTDDEDDIYWLVRWLQDRGVTTVVLPTTTRWPAPAAAARPAAAGHATDGAGADRTRGRAVTRTVELNHDDTCGEPNRRLSRVAEYPPCAGEETNR
jgi:hypothetical protein